MTTSIQGAVFDCDGTLMDSIKIWHELEMGLAEDAGVTLTRAEKDELNTLTIPEVGVFFHERFGIMSSVQDVLDHIHHEMFEFYSKRSELRCGAAEFVHALCERGIPCSVASSTPPDLLRAGLEHVGLDSVMSTILSVDDVGHSKREPHVFLRCCEVMGTEPTFTWGFEDSIYAIDTLNNAGFKTVGVYATDDAGTFADLSAAADVCVRGFDELDGSTFGSAD